MLRSNPALVALWRWLRRQQGEEQRLDRKPQQRLRNADFRQNAASTLPGRALLSYLVPPAPAPDDDLSWFYQGSIYLWHAREIVKALNDLGYSVDVIDYQDTDFVSSSEYDLFVGHAGINFEQLSRQLSPRAVRIYFSTGLYWRDWNVREAKRVCDLAVRRGYLLHPDRHIRYSEEYANQTADGIICLGNQEAVATYRQFPRVRGINNAVHPVQAANLQPKDYDAGRRHFLFFSGGGNVHKGLDLLLETFARTDLHLHVCQQIDDEFGEAYRHELTECPNIHVHGLIPMRSPQFEALAARCNWIISATCAEGQPQAVLECMGYGLIPILPTSANIDLDGFGLLLPGCDVTSIRQAVTAAAALPADECRGRAISTAEAIGKEYTPAQFHHNFMAAVHHIVKETQLERASECAETHEHGCEDQ